MFDIILFVSSDSELYQTLKDLPKSSIVVGRNLVKAALHNHSLQRVVVSLDSQTPYVADIVRRCASANVEWVTVESAKELGNSVGIEVSCLCVGIKHMPNHN